MYYEFVHLPTSCQALRDILFGIICTVVIKSSDTFPGSMFSESFIILINLVKILQELAESEPNACPKHQRER